MLTLPNYQIGTQIYESANSIVYRGVKTDDNQHVILKVLKEDYPTPEELTRYRQEYEITKNLNFDGVVKSYGIEKYQNTLVIILEDFGGESLKNFLKASQPSFEKEESELNLLQPSFAKGKNPFFEKGGLEEISEFLHLAIQVADTLGQIHVANIIHKDINPANIVWNQETGQAKIIDFGISSRLPRENPVLKNPNQLEGTLAYISPEQTGRMNRALDYRTDLYSLGVTFYELLTGQLPFKATEALELVHCHIAKPPATVHDLNPKISTTLSEIVMKLMAKNADERYQSAFGLKYDLEQCLSRLQEAQRLSEEELGRELVPVPSGGGLGRGPDDCPGFDIAQHDFSGRFQIPQKLYGREKEIKILLQAFERVTAPPQSPPEGGRQSPRPLGEGPGERAPSEMILVAGYSGVGKSALVHEVHKPMTEKRGYFVAGKFDQYQRNIPYFALTQAFNGFCDYLLTESDAQLQTWRETIQKAVGKNGQVLIDVIPHLEAIIDPQPAIVEVGPQEAQNRLNLVFQNFFRAICQAEHPLVLFIDDLQWADSPSLNLLNTLMTDTQAQHFLIIGAYRDNEVSAAHPLMLTLDELEKAGTIINTIALPNLNKESVNTLIAETLSVEPDNVTALTDLVYEKTQGNAFFTHEFLKSLYEQTLLNFDVQRQQWHWEIAQIQALEVTDNVVELMAGKISHLPTDTQAVLKLASCIGTQFDLDTLAIIYQHTQKDTLAHLWTAISEGLLLPLDEHYKQLEELEAGQVIAHFKFQHDRVQQAAYSLIAEADKKAIHLQIGRLLLANTSENTLKAHLFDVVNQLNEGRDLIKEPLEKQKLIELNLAAGQKAKASSAYQPAKQFLNTSLELLDKDSWQTHYNLTKTLYEQAAETAYLCTEFEETVRLVDIVLQNAKTVLDKVKVYEVLMQTYTAQNELLKVVETMLSVLKLLGIEFPKQPTDSDTQRYLEETQSLLGDKPIEALIDLPTMTDPEKIAAMRIMSKGWNTSALAAPELFPLIAFKMVNLSLQYGNSLTSAYAYAVGGFLFCAMGHIDKGIQFGQLALTILERFNALEFKGKVLSWVSAGKAWKKPVRSLLKPLIEAYQSGLETGDLEIAAQAASDYLLLAYLAGQELTFLQREIVTYTEAIKQLKQENVILYGLVIQQVILNLVGQNENPVELIGQAYNEKTMFSSFGEDFLGTFFFYMHKLILGYLFHDYTGALENADKTNPEYMAGTFYMAAFLFYESLTRLAVYPNASDDEQKSILDKVSAYQEQMQNWASHAPMNFQHKHDVIEAEKARVLGQDLTAMDLYEKAIAGAKQNQYLQEEALSYELAGQFYLGRGMERIAQTYLREAHYAYQRWGALAKVKQLEDQYPQWLEKKTTKTRFTDTQTTITQSTLINQAIEPTVTLTPATLLAEKSSLDLSTVMKASQAISREIRLDSLIKIFMQIVLENVGAEQGCLIMKGDLQLEKEETSLADELFLEAYATLDHVEILGAIPLSEVAEDTSTGQCFSPAIITYTARKQVPQVLNDARHEGLFINDSHIMQRQPQSVLCFPIMYKNELTGIFYLENNQTTGAFTSDRLAVLKMLASQIAISLENAQYANHLEEKVKQRTAQLAAANEEITTLNEMLKEENLRMSAELDVAKQLQQMVLPKETELEQIEELDIAGFMEPADEVGGDYYDVLVENGRVKIGIGDVTGHGLESGVLMIMVQMGVQTLLTNEVTDPEAFLTVLNRAVYKNVQRIETDKNLTLSLLDYQPNTKIPPNPPLQKGGIPPFEKGGLGGILRVTGQHEDILLVRQNGEVERIDTFDLGFSVGLKADIAPLVGQIELSLQPGDGIVLYTDGITEAQNPDEEQYGMERLCEVVSQNWHLSAKEIQQAVIADVRRYIDTQIVFDDITLLILKQR